MNMIITDIIASPIIFTKVVPDNWALWWKLWNHEALSAIKVAKNHNTTGANWKALNVYVKPGIDSTEYTGYKIKNIICPELFPSVFDNLDSFPIDIAVMQIVSSRSAVIPHTDNTRPKISVRSMMYDNNFTPTFYYIIDGEKKYQTLPDDTNTWMYHDNKCQHGSDHYFGHSKHLIVYHGTVKQAILDKNLTESANKYDKYIISRAT